MSTRKLSALCAAIVIFLGIGRTAHAGFIWNGVDGAPAGGTHLRISLANFEYTIDVDGSQGFGAGAIVPLADTIGDEIRGIFVIDSIDNVAGTMNFWQKSATQELSGSFSGYFVKSVTGSVVDFTGGITKIYSDMTPDFDSDFSKVPGVDPLAVGHGDGFADGTLFLDAVGVGAAVPGDLTITLSTTILPPGSGISGVGLGFLSIVGGSGAGFFGPDAEDPAGIGGIAGFQDLKLVNTITVNPAFPSTSSAWPVTSGDPITGFAVPEPSSLLLFALGFGAIGLVGRRRKKSLKETV